MIQGILFDLDDTLYAYAPAHEKADAALTKAAAADLSISRETWEHTYSLAKAQVKARIPTQGASHNRLLYIQNTLELLQVKPVPMSLRLYECYWDTFLSNMHLQPNVRSCLDFCVQNGIKLGICSDLTAHIQHRKLEKLGLCAYFDAIVTSEEAGAEKPDERMFFYALEQLKTPKKDTLFVGDSLQKDIDGAKAFGLKSMLAKDFFEQYECYIRESSCVKR